MALHGGLRKILIPFAKLNDMRRLRINNLGPIKEACLDLGRVNVIIGQQSSGKSCVLKTACYCAWVEKRLELTQNPELFDDISFIQVFSEYYNMSSYVQKDTYIEYETDYLKFQYMGSKREFRMEWKVDRWDYRRPKVSYIPADRNLVAAIPSWSSVPLDENLLEFMANWDKARKYVGVEKDILGLGMSYEFDKQSNTDTIRLSENHPLTLKESSSGIQSLIPMFVHLDYMTKGLYDDDGVKLTYEQKEERNALMEVLRSIKSPVEAATLFELYTRTDHSEIFLEEPENNLFPPTQCQFVDWLLEAVKDHDDMLFVATHSPYILNQFIKDDPKGLTVFFTHGVNNDAQLYTVRQLHDDEIREIYENGVDMFFNFEAYI